MNGMFAHSAIGESSRYRVRWSAESCRDDMSGLGPVEMKYSCAIIHYESGLLALNGFSIAFGQMIWRVSNRSTSVPFFV